MLPLLIRLSRCTEESVFSSRNCLWHIKKREMLKRSWNTSFIVKVYWWVAEFMFATNWYPHCRLMKAEYASHIFPSLPAESQRGFQQMLSRMVVTFFYFFIEWGRGTFWWYFVLIKWIMLKLWPETKQTNEWFGIMLLKLLKQLSSSCALEKRFEGNC